MSMNTSPLLESTTVTITNRDGTTKAGSERQKSTNGAAHVTQTNKNQVPEEQVYEWEGVVGTGDNSVLYQSAVDLYGYDTHAIQNDGGAGASITVQVKTHPDAAWSPDCALHQIDNVTTAYPPAVTLANTKVGYLKGRFYQFRVLQNGATNPAAGSINGTHTNSGGAMY